MAKKKNTLVKEEIIIEAQKLFQQYGLRKATMGEIAKACEKTNSTLYHYYKNKEEVFDAVLQKEIINLRKEVSKKEQRSGIRERGKECVPIL